MRDASADDGTCRLWRIEEHADGTLETAVEAVLTVGRAVHSVGWHPKDASKVQGPRLAHGHGSHRSYGPCPRRAPPCPLSSPCTLLYLHSLHSQVLVADDSGAVRFIDVESRSAVLTLQADLPFTRGVDWHPIDPLRYLPLLLPFPCDPGSGR